jgi:hypothetical protein
VISAETIRAPQRVVTPVPLFAVTEEDVRRQVDTNSLGRSASIADVSTAGTSPHPAHSAVHVGTASAPGSATRILAEELAPRGIRPLDHGRSGVRRRRSASTRGG